MQGARFSVQAPESRLIGDDFDYRDARGRITSIQNQ